MAAAQLRSFAGPDSDDNFATPAAIRSAVFLLEMLTFDNSPSPQLAANEGSIECERLVGKDSIILNVAEDGLAEASYFDSDTRKGWEEQIVFSDGMDKVAVIAIFLLMRKMS